MATQKDVLNQLLKTVGILADRLQASRDRIQQLQTKIHDMNQSMVAVQQQNQALVEVINKIKERLLNS